MDRKVVRCTCIVALTVSLLAPKAFGSAVIGATEPTQWLNQLNLIASYIEHVTTKLQNIEQTKDAVLNSARGALQPYFDVKQRLDDVRDTVKDGLGIAYSVQNLDQVFLDKYKNFDDFRALDYDHVKYTEDLKTWTQTTKDSIKNALTATGIAMEGLDDEEVIMQQLYAKARDGGEGRQKAIDVANEIAAINTKQMQSLRQLIATDMQIKAAYFQQETVKDEATAASKGEFYSPQFTPGDDPILGDSSSQNFPDRVTNIP